MLDHDHLLHNNFELCQFDTSYIFLCAESGSAEIQIDFIKGTLSAGQALIIKPGQAFRCIRPTDDAKCYSVAIAKSLLPDIVNRKLDYILLDSSPFPVSRQQVEECASLFSILQNRGKMSSGDDFGSEAIVALALASIISEAMAAHVEKTHASQLVHIPLLHQLSALFDTDLRISRLPSHYAGQLGISAGSLNEKIRNALGINISLYIRRESILRACRLLAMSDMPVKDVALLAGYDDPAYFTRLFSKHVGMNPTAFRREASWLSLHKGTPSA